MIVTKGILFKKEAIMQEILVQEREIEQRIRKKEKKKKKTKLQEVNEEI